MRKIAVTGYLALDIMPIWGNSSISQLIPGHLLKMEGVRLSVGGVVGNTGMALKKLGTDIILRGKIGNDHFGRIILEILKQYDKDLVDNIIISSDDMTSYTIVLNPADTDRIFLNYSGANDTFSIKDIEYDLLKDVIIYHFGYPPLMKHFYIDEGENLSQMFKNIQRLGIITSLDMAMPDPSTEAGKINWENVFINILKYVDIFMPSLEELLYMIDKNSYELLNRNLRKSDVVTTDLLNNLSNRLLKMGAKIIGIKLGDQGLYIKTADEKTLKESNLRNIINVCEWGNKEFITPCYRSEVVGTTGAGDTTIAGFLSAMERGISPELAAKIAVAVGALSVSSVDSTEKIVSFSEVESKIKNRWECLPLNIKHEHWIYKDFYGGLFINTKN